MDAYKKLQQHDLRKDGYMLKVIEGPDKGGKLFLEEEELTEAVLFGTGLSPEIIRTHRGLLRTGENTWFLEKVSAENEMIICGAGHVSMSIIRLARMVGFKVTVIDDRPVFTQKALEAGAHRVFCRSFEEALEDIPGSGSAYFVIVTRGHTYDIDCMRLILKKPWAYTGMMGSRKRVESILEQMKEEGYAQAVLDRVCTPIGLRIGAQTPEEIAVSILAQIIQRKNEIGTGQRYSPELIKALAHGQGKRVLATIIDRRGSAPREIGAKMVICEDGQTVDTIGGGLLEASVLKRGKQLLRENGESCRMRADLMNREAADRGMVCGGSVDVFLERI